MDDLRGSFSRLKKDIKHRFKKSERKVDKLGIEGDEERVGSSGSLPRPEPRVLTGGGREHGGNGLNADDESVGPSAAADSNRSEWKSTASASAKLLLRGVRDSADAFAPLKSVAGGLCFILESCEVWLHPHRLSTKLTNAPENESKQTWDRITGASGQRTRRATLSSRCRG